MATVLLGSALVVILVSLRDIKKPTLRKRPRLAPDVVEAIYKKFPTDGDKKAKKYESGDYNDKGKRWDRVGHDADD